MQKIEDLIKTYIKEEVKKLETETNEIHLTNVYPSIIENVLGNFKNGYEINGYDCDYWAETDIYIIEGCMKYGKADISLKHPRFTEKEVQDMKDGKEIKKEKCIDDFKEPIGDISNWKTFYVTFPSYGSFRSGCVQPIVAPSELEVRKLNLLLFDKNWCDIRTEDYYKNHLIPFYKPMGITLKELDALYWNEI